MHGNGQKALEAGHYLCLMIRTDTHAFPLADLPKGMYFVHILAPNGASGTFKAVRF